MNSETINLAVNSWINLISSIAPIAVTVTLCIGILSWFLRFVRGSV